MSRCQETKQNNVSCRKGFVKQYWKKLRNEHQKTLLKIILKRALSNKIRKIT
jgi:hypothetical protein